MINYILMVFKITDELSHLGDEKVKFLNTPSHLPYPQMLRGDWISFLCPHETIPSIKREILHLSHNIAQQRDKQESPRRKGSTWATSNILESQNHKI